METENLNAPLYLQLPSTQKLTKTQGNGNIFHVPGLEGLQLLK